MVAAISYDDLMVQLKTKWNSLSESDKKKTDISKLLMIIIKDREGLK